MRECVAERSGSTWVVRRRVLVALVGLALVAPSIARADVDLSNDWVVRVGPSGGPPSLVCDLAFAQSAGTLVVSGSCRSGRSDATLSGTVDPQTGAFSVSGGVGYWPPTSSHTLSLTGAPAGDGSELSGTAILDGQPRLFAASLCGNGTVDGGEACDDGTTIGGCCTTLCTPKADGLACTSTEACQSQPTCSAGACVGTPRPAGIECEADGNRCTSDACDGAGACAQGPCSPCCGGPTCEPQPRYGTCKGPTNSSDLIDIQATPFGAKDKLVWTLPAVSGTAREELPDPQTTDYAVCLYTLDGEDDFGILAYQMVAPAGLGCGRARCWTENAKGVSYNGGPARPDGVASLRVTSGVEGKAKLSFVGKGLGLGLTTPLAIAGGELLVELHAGESCWSAQYVNLGSKPSIRTSTRYRQRGRF